MAQCKFLFLMVTILLVGCASQSVLPTNPPSASLTVVDVATAAATVATATPTPSIQAQKEEILRQIRQAATDYNSLVDDEKKTGEYEATNLGPGKQGFRFMGSSYSKISAKFDELISRIEDLNKRYAALSPASPLPIPTFTSKAVGQVYLNTLLETDTTWIMNELVHGTIVVVYDPDAVDYVPELIGDSYVTEQAQEIEVNKLRMWVRGPSAAAIQQDVQMIQRIEPGNVDLTDVTSLPFYRNDLSLTQYDTSSRTYIVYSEVHAIIEIIPKDPPSGVTNLSTDELEVKARALIALFAPGLDLSQLTPAPGSKIGTYFFRWEDRTKPVLDDGMSHPFIQVGLNGDGELLNYYNTLPLAR
jgi:hypothetical protein